MKKSQKPRYTLSNGTIVVFSNTKLKSAILRKKNELEFSGNKCSQQKLLEDISEETGIAFSTIKHWCAGHNAPTDIYKVQDIANALDVEVEFLLENEMEESVDMANTTNDKNIPVTDYSTTKTVIRSIYTSISEHIEMFRLISALGTDKNPLNLNFTNLYSQLMAARLDIPKDLFAKLDDFTTNYIQNLGHYHDYLLYLGAEDMSFETAEEFVEVYTNTYNFVAGAPWCNCLYVSVDEENEFCKAFERAIAEQYEWDNCVYNIDGIANEIIIKTAYECIENILKDYIS